MFSLTPEKHLKIILKSTRANIRTAFKILAPSQEARSKITTSFERTARLAAICQIKDLYISVIINFSGKEIKMKRKCIPENKLLNFCDEENKHYFHINFPLMRSGYYGSHLEFGI